LPAELAGVGCFGPWSELPKIVVNATVGKKKRKNKINGEELKK
jgi:hypothetical protein